MKLWVRFTVLVIGLVAAIILASKAGVVSRGQAQQVKSAQKVEKKNRTANLFFHPKHQVALGTQLEPYFAELPVANPPPGLVYKKTRVRMKTESKNVRLHYTIDGTEPDESSPLFPDKLDLIRTAVIKLRSYQIGRTPSRVKTYSYLRIRDGVPSIPVVSISSDEENLFKLPTGILVNSETQNPRATILGSFEFIGTKPGEYLERTATMRVRGGASRLHLNHSYQAVFQGPSLAEMKHLPEIFHGPGLTETSIGIRAGGQNVDEQMNNRVFNSLCEEAGMLLSRSVPARVYFNGRYRGLYHLRDIFERDYLQRRFPDGKWDLLTGDRDAGTKKPPYDGLNGQVQVFGNGLEEYRELLRHLSKSEEPLPEDLERINREVDLEKLTDYWIYNIWAGNRDWPSHNYFIARNTRGTDKRWRWLTWDTDFTFDFPWGRWAEPTLPRATIANSWQTGYFEIYNKPLLGYYLVNRLMLHESFREQFLTRLCDLMNTRLTTENVISHIDKIASQYPDEKLRDLEFWKKPAVNLKSRRNQLVKFAERRNAMLRNQICDHFEKIGHHAVEVSLPAGAEIQLNGLALSQPTWSGLYYDGCQLKISGASEIQSWRVNGHIQEGAKIRVEVNGPTKIEAISASAES